MISRASERSTIGSHHPLGFQILRKRRVEFVDLDVVAGHVRVREGRQLLGLLQDCLQVLLRLFQPHHRIMETFGSAASQNEIEQRVPLSVDLLDLRASAASIDPP
ncbi:hypothetical protein NS226_07750 [Aureimonas ureilytica]|uniref:Uncharacterized protein n=1 Tax=Aureimonas ureilytica TaxID=401562 RepID=A0A175RAK1_9HYPH|nr:hypothetical protein [Aureimonas ureilytica]KTQ96461.1 hypothetical protein NS226_07750 [Aureimonas ureilytica]